MDVPSIQQQLSPKGREGTRKESSGMAFASASFPDSDPRTHPSSLDVVLLIEPTVTEEGFWRLALSFLWLASCWRLGVWQQ